MICVNMQGVCASDETFSAEVCKHVGSTNDADCFETCSLKEKNEFLPFPYHWNGDPAYTLTEQLMVPFPGINLHIHAPLQESFNFWHSQVRILIERVFGMFIQCWGIFWVTSRLDLSFFWKLYTAAVGYIIFVRNYPFQC
jgi:hypothetical protein